MCFSWVLPTNACSTSFSLRATTVRLLCIEDRNATDTHREYLQTSTYNPFLRKTYNTKVQLIMCWLHAKYGMVHRSDNNDFICCLSVFQELHTQHHRLCFCCTQNPCENRFRVGQHSFQMTILLHTKFLSMWHCHLLVVHWLPFSHGYHRYGNHCHSDNDSTASSNSRSRLHTHIITTKRDVTVTVISAVLWWPNKCMATETQLYLKYRVPQ